MDYFSGHGMIRMSVSITANNPFVPDETFAGTYSEDADFAFGWLKGSIRLCEEIPDVQKAQIIGAMSRISDLRSRRMLE